MVFAAPDSQGENEMNFIGEHKEWEMESWLDCEEAKSAYR